MSPTHEPPEETAERAGLVHADPNEEPGYSRERDGDGWRYLHPDGSPVEDEEELQRLEELSVPPGWSDVWISTEPDAHLQAVGVDDAGRRQYRYHPDWEEARSAARFHHVLRFARDLPDIRAQVREDLERDARDRRRAAAAAVTLIDEALLRVGNEEYAREHGHHGATTLRPDHVTVDGDTVHLDFTGKSGKEREVTVADGALADALRDLQELPEGMAGDRVLRYRNDRDEVHGLQSKDVNAYLREAGDGDHTTKDFRTWGATAHAVEALVDGDPPAQGDDKSPSRWVVEQVAERLGNTPDVCRDRYVHPGVLEHAGEDLEGAVDPEDALDAETREHLHPPEAHALALLDGRTGG